MNGEFEKWVARAEKNQWNNWIGNGDVAKYNVIFSIYLMFFYTAEACEIESS